MKFDTIIIGGGLSGLTCGINLAQKGKKCAIISSGQSALHFFSGSLDLLNNVNGEEVKKSFEAMHKLPESHPYKRIGIDNVERLEKGVKPFFQKVGITFNGEGNKNHFVISPIGKLKQTWLTLDDFDVFETKEAFKLGKTIIVNITGFLDFHTDFIAGALKEKGIETQIKTFGMTAFDRIRQNPSEMRSTNIAKLLENDAVLDEFAQKCNTLSDGFDHILLPSIFGLVDKKAVNKIKEKVNKSVSIIPVIPPSVPGIRCQMALKSEFERLGGTFLMGDNVLNGDIENGKLTAVFTEKHAEMEMRADDFVLASGSFYGKGLIATKDCVVEPILNADVDADHNRGEWFDKKVFNEQPFMRYGVKTDTDFKVVKNGKPLKNVYATGSVLSGADSLKDGSGAGIAILSSMFVVEKILK